MKASGFSMLISFLLLLLQACHSDKGGKTPLTGTGLSYAGQYSLEEAGDCTLLSVYNPWQNSRGIRFEYLLGKEGDGIPDSLSALPFIRVPVSRVIAMSTTHIAMIGGLGKAESIVGLSGSSFVYDPRLRERIEAGLVRDVGYGQGLNFEAIVELEPDVLFIYGVEGGITSTVAKLEELGITVVYCADYLEQNPLGKAEWIRFFASFFGENISAREKMDSIAKHYNRLRKIVGGVEKKPKVLTGLPWKDVWYMAGGRSYAARLIEDAGGDYLWAGNASAEAQPLDLESVYSRAVEAEIWINPGAAHTVDEILDTDPRFGDLPVMKSGRVYNNDLRMSPGGGNDYWESGTLRPDLVLADLISVFHPELEVDHEFTYYRCLK